MPAMFAMLGHRINSRPGDAEADRRGSDLEAGFWWRWARLVMRRPLLIGGIGLAIVGILLVLRLAASTPARPSSKAERGKTTDDAVVGYDKLVGAGISPGVLKPFIVLVEHNDSSGTLRRSSRRLDRDRRASSGAAAPTSMAQGQHRSWSRRSRASTRRAGAAEQHDRHAPAHDPAGTRESGGLAGRELTLGGRRRRTATSSTPSTASSPTRSRS